MTRLLSRLLTPDLSCSVIVWAQGVVVMACGAWLLAGAEWKRWWR